MTDEWLDRHLADLGDERAIHILKNLSDDQTGGAAQIGAAEFASELRHATGVSSGMSGALTDAELARATLRFLAADGAYEEQLRASVECPQPEAFLGGVETVLVASAVVMLLQSHFKMDRDKDGGFTFSWEKKPTETDLLGKIIGGLSSR